jgi:hypothetical protein
MGRTPEACGSCQPVMVASFVVRATYGTVSVVACRRTAGSCASQGCSLTIKRVDIALQCSGTEDIQYSAQFSEAIGHGHNAARSGLAFE